MTTSDLFERIETLAMWDRKFKGARMLLASKWEKGEAEQALLEEKARAEIEREYAIDLVLLCAGALVLEKQKREEATETSPLMGGSHAPQR